MLTSTLFPVQMIYLLLWLEGRSSQSWICHRHTSNSSWSQSRWSTAPWTLISDFFSTPVFLSASVQPRQYFKGWWTPFCRAFQEHCVTLTISWWLELVMRSTWRTWKQFSVGYSHMESEWRRANVSLCRILWSTWVTEWMQRGCKLVPRR